MAGRLTDFFQREKADRQKNFATEFVRSRDEGRRTMIASLIRNTNRLVLISRARSIAAHIREQNAPFSALYDFETLLARRLHPGRTSHPVADYHYGSYYRERARRYEGRIKDLADRDRLVAATLIPILAELDHAEGPQFVLLFLKEAVRPRAAKLADHLLDLEKDHHGLKARLSTTEAVDEVEARETVVRDFHEYLESHGKNLGRWYIARAELDPVLEPHVAHLRQILETQDPDEEEARILTSNDSALADDDFVKQEDAGVDETIAPTAESAFEAALAAEAEVEATATEEAHPFEEADAETATATEDQAPDEDSIEDAGEIYEDSETYEDPPASDIDDDATDADVPPADEEERRLLEYLARKRGELEEIERRLNQDLADIQAEDRRRASPENVEDDPGERADRAARGLGDELYRRYHPQLREILDDADGLFARIFALLSSLARRLTIPEMRMFVDHLIAELEKDPAVREREPHLIPRLVNYRNSLREETPRLLNMIHQKLAEIRRAGGEPVDVIAAQLDYLHERLRDETFQSIWPTIFTIYQNIIEQQFDARVFDEIAQQPLHKQQRILAALKEGLPEHSRARRAVEARLRGAELASVGERLDREQDEEEHTNAGETPGAPTLDGVLKTLRRTHAYDPVERVRNEIAAFDAGQPPSPQAADESVTARAEEVRRLFVEDPEGALTFAESILNDVAAPPAERAAVLERIREEAESPPASGEQPEPWRERAGLTYLFHQTVESAGDAPEKIKRINEFEAAGVPLPAESFAEKRRSVERERRSNAAAAALSNALQEKDTDKRKALFQSFLDNPEAPEGLRRELRAGHDDRFDEAFTSITAAAHTAANKARMLTALRSIAHSRRILNPERDRRLRAAIDRYRRMAQTHDALDDTNRGTRSFFLRNGAQLPRLVAGKQSPAAVFPEIFARERKHAAEYRASLEALHILESGAAEGWLDVDNLDEAPEFIRKAVAPAFQQVIQRRYNAARSRRPKETQIKKTSQASSVMKLLKSDRAPSLPELRRAYAQASPAERVVLHRIARLQHHAQIAEAARQAAQLKPAQSHAKPGARRTGTATTMQTSRPAPAATEPGRAQKVASQQHSAARTGAGAKRSAATQQSIDTKGKAAPQETARPASSPTPASATGASASNAGKASKSAEATQHRRIVTEAGETFQETVLEDINTPVWDDGSVPAGLTSGEDNFRIDGAAIDADTPLELESAPQKTAGSKKAAGGSASKRANRPRVGINAWPEHSATY